MERPPERRRGHHPGPNQPLQGRRQAHTQLTSPRAYQGRPDTRVRTPRTLLGLSPCPRARRGWDRVTVREPQVTRVCAKRPRRSVLPLSWGPGLAGALRPLPASPCLCALGTEGLWGGQCGPGREVREAGPGLVPKIAHRRNHQGADTDANTRVFFTNLFVNLFIYKLELGSKCTRHSGAGTWTPRWVPA